MALVYEIFFFFASLATEISKPQRNKMLCVKSPFHRPAHSSSCILWAACELLAQRRRPCSMGPGEGYWQQTLMSFRRGLPN